MRPFDLLDVLGVEDQGPDPGLFQGLVDAQPVDAGRLHGRSGDAEAEQPVRELLQPLGQGLELLSMGLRLSIGAGDQNGCGDLHLVHIKSRRTAVDDIETVGTYHISASERVGGGGRSGEQRAADSHR